LRSTSRGGLFHLELTQELAQLDGLVGIGLGDGPFQIQLVLKLFKQGPYRIFRQLIDQSLGPFFQSAHWL